MAEHPFMACQEKCFKKKEEVRQIGSRDYSRNLEQSRNKGGYCVPRINHLGVLARKDIGCGLSVLRCQELACIRVEA
jgi:hypothetical protein